MQRVVSIADLSSQLIDAFMESNGEHKAVVFVDQDNDTFIFNGISYDPVNKSIKINLRIGYESVGSPSIHREIEVANKT